MSDNDLGEYVKSMRKEKGYTLKQLGDKIGFSDGYLSMVENGIKKNPSSSFIVRLSEELELSTDDILSMAEITSKEMVNEDIRSGKEVNYLQQAKNKQEKALNNTRRMVQMISEQGNLKDILSKNPYLRWGDRYFTSDEIKKIYQFIEYFILDEGDN